MKTSTVPYPILANTSDFEKPSQVEKINTIVKGQYNTYLEKTVQKKARPTRLNNLVRSYSNTVADIHDVNYGSWNFITMDFSTAGMTYDTLYPILKIKKGRVPTKDGVKPAISFVGVDKEEHWKEMLNNCGVFVFSFNRLAQEQQIAFRTYTKQEMTDIVDGKPVLRPIIQTGWHVTLSFYYDLLEK